VDDATSLDALLWVKLPGESDGACNGGPAAGQWWQEIALELAANADW
jgi:endoglucanase